jgi:hypothetical protein
VTSSFYKTAERYPPVLVRLLARKEGRAMTTGQIAMAAGWGVHYVEGIVREHTWENVILADLRKFTSACGLDFTSRADTNRVETYFRTNHGKPSFKYLTKAPDWKSYYLPLILDWRKSLPAIPTTLPLPIQRLLKGLPQ